MNQQTEIPETGCCPKFDPTPWDEQIVEWDNKRFIKDQVLTLFYMPVNFGKVMQRLDEKVQKADAIIPDYLCLSDHTTKWNMDVYLAVDREVPEAENITLSGKYVCKVYEGSYKDTDKWNRDFDAFVKEKGLTVNKWYMWYTTCPKCAKIYEKNYVVIVADIA